MHSTFVFKVGAKCLRGRATIDWLLDPIREFGATAERDHYAGALILALVVVIVVGAIMRTFFSLRAKRDKDLHELETKRHELEIKRLANENERIQRELDNARRREEDAADNEAMGRLPALFTMAFEQAGKAVAPQFEVFNNRFNELISETKRNNDLSEQSIRQREIQQQQVIATNKAGFNDLGVRINDKIDDMVKRVDLMKDSVIEDLGKQIEGMLEEIKKEISNLPDATAQSVASLLDQHKTELDAKLQLILSEIRASQTQPIKPVDPPAE